MLAKVIGNDSSYTRQAKVQQVPRVQNFSAHDEASKNFIAMPVPRCNLKVLPMHVHRSFTQDSSKVLSKMRNSNRIEAVVAAVEMIEQTAGYYCICGCSTLTNPIKCHTVRFIDPIQR